ncbi:thiol-disulfide oxidoreductase DCC family protein [Paenibacillus sp. MMO-177]|uniref:thiol-disulfide oxidoreductase DCC family protein n=1 Tax=Paenibacillus sp. MMO-177 TaxID=3081289 RepID=UPI003016B6FF
MKSEREKLYVVYDGTCNLCTGTVSKLKELRSNADLIFVPIQSLDGAGNHVPGIEKAAETDLYEKMHVADEKGRLYAGADGVVRILRTIKGFRLLASLYRLPGLSRVGDLLYRYIAKRRYDWFGRTEQSCSVNGCTLPPQHEREKGNL